jgi:MFS family permease
MQTVGAAWLMTQLTTSTLYVALIQTAAALPFFVLALPAGSIGDIVDRRKLVLGTELWMFAVACVLAVATLAGWMTPWLLLVLTFGLSMGDAMESPTWRALLPELVPKDELQAGLALNGIEFNLARAVGPGLAGLVIAVAGIGWAFVMNAASFLGVIAVIAGWKRPARKSQVPAETLGGATVAAVRFVRFAPSIRKLLFRSACVIFFSSAFWALLPPIAKALSRTSLGYGLLLGFFGTGAVLGAVVLHKARKVFSVEVAIAGATAMFAVVMLATAMLHVLWALCLFMLFGGAAWTVFMSIFSTLVQNFAPDWVRARVLAIYLFVFQGAVALGSTLWGVAAERTSAHMALMWASVGTGLCMALPLVARLPDTRPDLDVWDHWKRPTLFEKLTPDEGPVLVTVEYRIDPKNVEAFLDAIYKYQGVRRRDGASRWGIYFDSEKPGVYLESFVVHSWAEHERQHVRFTMADKKVEDEVSAFVVGEPKVRHFIWAERDRAHEHDGIGDGKGN